MGKNLIQQRRGKGSIFRAMSHTYKGEARHPAITAETITATVHLIEKCPGHSAPVATIRQSNGVEGFMIVPEGIREKDTITIGNDAEIKPGNTLTLEKIPDGTIIYNVEINPGDGGKIARAAGTSAKLVAKLGNKATIILPSKKEKTVNIKCRATIGTTAGGGQPEKPLVKAGKNFHRKKARRKLYPVVGGVSMSAVAHPFGGKKSSKKGRPTQSARSSPPGRKVGKIAPRRTGRRR